MIALKSNTAPTQVSEGFPALDAVLDRRGCADALAMFRKGLDTVEIAWRLECTPAAAANGIAAARERERRL